MFKYTCKYQEQKNLFHQPLASKKNEILSHDVKDLKFLFTHGVLVLISQSNMMKLIVLLTIFGYIFALPINVQKRDVDKIAFPDEIEASTSTLNIKPQKVEEPLADKGNGTDLDNRFLGLGVGLGYALGQKLFGGHSNYPGKFF